MKCRRRSAKRLATISVARPVPPGLLRTSTIMTLAVEKLLRTSSIAFAVGSGPLLRSPM
jgi:hypothetical protein